MNDEKKLLEKYCRPHNLAEFSFTDKITQKLVPKLPISISNVLRNNFEHIVDRMTKFLVSIMATSKPQLIIRFLQLSRRIKTIILNKNDKNDNNNNNNNNNNKSTENENDEYLEIFDGPDKIGHVLLFVHGGAWGSGKPWMYRLVAEGIANRMRPCSKIILLGYPLFPKTFIDDQVLCCRKALLYIHGHRNELGIGINEKIVLCGHSSGANVCALSVCSESDSNDNNHFSNHLCHSLLLMSGVFDIEKHYSWEASRGLHLISPMGAAARSFSRFWESSPTIRFKNNSNNSNSNNSSNNSSNNNSNNNSNSNNNNVSIGEKKNTFVIALIHAVDDDTVPFSSSEELATVLKARGHQVLTLYPKGSHMDPLMWMMEDNSITNDEINNNNNNNNNYYNINYQLQTFLSRFSLLLSTPDNRDLKLVTTKPEFIHSKL